ncbi:MAG: flagellar hook-basal body complex protein [Elusimicrobia bacterium]|nr:flagellar hook-basal body complex protein [Elusimicrobiota bacterium]
MMPALFSGVSGLRNHQFRMNVIGNNLANVNTVGFKYSRVSFSDLVYQTIRDASAPQSVGGSNPVQMGLGSLVHSVDVVNTQGNLESTGRNTDLSIQGEGFFVLNDGAQNKYTRAGIMVMGLNGSLVNPADGLNFMGWNAVNGVVDNSGPLTTINIPVGDVLPAQQTTHLTFNGNLNATGNVAQGTISNSHALLAAAAGGTLATGLKNSTGGTLGLNAGDVIAISGSVGGTLIAGATLTVNAGTTLTDVANALQAALRSVPDGDLTETVAVQSDGSLRVTSDGTNNVANLQMTVAGNTLFNNALRFPVNIAGGGLTGDSDTLRRSAQATDAMVDLYDSTGTALGLQVGDDVTLVSASAKGAILSDVALLADITGATTYADYRDALRDALFTASPALGEDVTIQANGALQITGAAGASEAVTGIVLGAGPNPSDDQRSAFSTSQSFAETQKALDATSFRTAPQIFDSLGNALNVDFRFTKTANNSWQWDATYGGNAVGSGVLNFGTDGQLTTPTGSVSIPLTNGAASPLAVGVDFAGTTQFAGTSSVVLKSQDGYASSTLNGFSIGQAGDVTGVFSNGKNVALGQLAIASFRNPSGLLREGRNLYVESPNSGVASAGVAGINGRGLIVSGTLEMSNVDVAREFTDMIVTQRGFQANSRVITASDQLLEELVNLKR